MTAIRAFFYTSSVITAGYTIAAALAGLDWTAFGVAGVILSILAHGTRDRELDFVEAVRKNGMVVREIQPPTPVMGVEVPDRQTWTPPTEAFDSLLAEAAPRGRHG